MNHFAKTLMLFGAALVFLLVSGSPVNAQSVSQGDYDVDDDRLIEISNLEQLDAVRYDLDGDGIPDQSSDQADYLRAFPSPVARLGCPDGGCDGYELTRDLDFDDPSSYASGSVDRSWNRGEGGEGWLPIGPYFDSFTSTFDGNDHTIANLFIDRDAEYVGLFGSISSAGSIQQIGLVDVEVGGRSSVGPLVGINVGTIIGCYATGSVTGTDTVGGLVGGNSDHTGTIIGSYATSSVSGNNTVGGLAGGNWNTIVGSHATGNVAGTITVGGLVGWNSASIGTSYATGNVWGSHTVGGLVGNSNSGGVVVSSYAAGNVVSTDAGIRVGGLVGENYGSIRGSYAKGNVLGGSRVGGLVGANFSHGTIISSYAIGAVSGGSSGGLLGYNSDSSVVIASYATGAVLGNYDAGGLAGGNDRSNGISVSYWDVESSGQSVGVASGFNSGVEGKTTAELQAPTSYEGIYRNWNTDIDNADGDGYEATGADDPWDFGTQNRYPALRADLDGDGLTTWEEFGKQHVAVEPLSVEERPKSPKAVTLTDAPLGSCTNGLVVEDPQENPGLVSDCEVLSRGRDTLAGRATLNWSTDLPINRWQGITVEGSPPRVIELRLDSTALSGQIPPQLGELSALRVLSFRINDLAGGIPPELGRLTELRFLDLHGNGEVEGTIPPELGNLSNLEHMDLDAVGLTGNIPPELSNLTKLEWLGLGQNQLSGSIPPQLAELSSLEALLLGRNELTGAIPPELGNLANLDLLFLSSNRLTGNIPLELGQLSNLFSLYLSENRLTGTIPPELANLSKLSGLSLRDNQLTGEIPSWLSGQSQMDTIDLGNNSFTGPIPPGLGNLSWLTTLYLFGNQLTGTIPPELGNLARLGDFSLRDNKLTGPIPRELANLARVQAMDLSHNDLTGVIPPEFGILSSLQFLGLENNRLTGNIPAELGELAQLRSLRLNDNQLTGPIPDEMVALPKLVQLNIAGNELTGCLPWHLTQKLVLDISHDGLRTCLPPVAEGGMFSIEASLLVDDNTLMIVAVGDAVNGTVFLDGTTVNYEHDGSETTTDSFSYIVSDGTDTATTTAEITVTPVNDPPVAVADKAAVDEEDALYIEAPALLYNDTDAENDLLSIVEVGDAVNGAVSLDGTTITYKHDGSETTTASFAYTVTDGTDVDTTKVEITVGAVNDPPVAVADTAAMDEGDTLSMEASALLDNDTDAENEALNITEIGDAVNGDVFLDGTTVIYKHDGSETTTASFSYTVSDGADTDTAAVEITVAPVNDPPVAVTDTAVVDEGDTLFIETSALLDNDTDAENDTLSITEVGDVLNGIVTLSGTGVSFEHDGFETTAAGFSYTVTDGVDTDTTMVEITIVPVNDPPVAVADTAAMDEGVALSLEASSLLSNDTDAESDGLAIVAVGDAFNGIVSLDGNTVTYEHDGSETTTGSFSYTVTDGTDVDTTEVEIIVATVNDPPVAVADKAAVDEGETVYVEAPALLYNDTDGEDDTLSIIAVGDALNGEVSLDGTTIIYAHDGSETTIGRFSYTVTDGTNVDAIDVEIIVAPVNDPPIAIGDKGTVDEGDTLYMEAPALLYNDTDAENDTLGITAVWDALNGSVSLDGMTITYEHDGSETTAGGFSYTVSDGTDIDNATVEITVVPIDDPPVAAEETATVTPATPRTEATASPTSGNLWPPLRHRPHLRRFPFLQQTMAG